MQQTLTMFQNVFNLPFLWERVTKIYHYLSVLWPLSWLSRAFYRSRCGQTVSRLEDWRWVYGRRGTTNGCRGGIPIVLSSVSVVAARRLASGVSVLIRLLPTKIHINLNKNKQKKNIENPYINILKLKGYFCAVPQAATDSPITMVFLNESSLS